VICAHQVTASWKSRAICPWCRSEKEDVIYQIHSIVNIVVATAVGTFCPIPRFTNTKMQLSRLEPLWFRHPVFAICVKFGIGRTAPLCSGFCPTRILEQERYKHLGLFHVVLIGGAEIAYVLGFFCFGCHCEKESRKQCHGNANPRWVFEEDSPNPVES